ncbi:HEAT repeat domain-containing protein [Pseudomonas arsenicoxydans]|uniref:HEAT repeat domain-containing protein n=1 Tax=Pseudomonas arsenicoxydans TaxID=702115 RepID=A0A502HLG4_9PSED|nr:HEAT repeat domain-containing protein [Pseudomonas arsenicoxydans]TPG75639.1 HEAT repeat domain-containing protein [Pseudomonas arsenicoxydans]
MKSKEFDELNYWLGPDENSTWNEYTAEQVAKGVLEKFSTEDWQRLNNSILSKAEYWQERSAAALGEQRSASAIEILKTLLDSQHKEVIIAAASELDWTEASIEQALAKKIKHIIESMSVEELDSYPELTNLLKKAENSKT